MEKQLNALDNNKNISKKELLQRKKLETFRWDDVIAVRAALRDWFAVNEIYRLLQLRNVPFPLWSFLRPGIGAA